MENTKIFYAADYHDSIASSFAYYLRLLLPKGALMKISSSFAKRFFPIF